MNFLQRLFSRKKTEVQELPPEFLQSNPPDWLLDLKGSILPHGNNFSVRTQIWQGSRKGSVDLLILPQCEGEEPQTAASELLPAEIDRLLVLIGFSFPDDIENVPDSVADGLPVTLAIHRHEPYLVQTAACNLGEWLETKKSRPPTVEISWNLLEVQKRVLLLK